MSNCLITIHYPNGQSKVFASFELNHEIMQLNHMWVAGYCGCNGRKVITTEMSEDETEIWVEYAY